MRSEFSPQDIVNQRFLTTIGGYDKEEVQKFLRAIARELQDKNDLIEEYRRQAESRVGSPDAEALHEALQATRSLVSELGSKLDAATQIIDELQGLAVEDVAADVPVPDLPVPDLPVMDVPAEDPSVPTPIEVIASQEEVTTPEEDVSAPEEEVTSPEEEVSIPQGEGATSGAVVAREEVELAADDRATEIELPSEEWEELFEDPLETERGTPRP